jgi:cytochrome c peroxidase
MSDGVRLHPARNLFSLIATVICFLVTAPFVNAQPAPHVLRKLDALSKVPVPPIPGLNQYIRNNAAAVQLGKALFWDMNVGSDGNQACATCHFNAGADSRAVNQVSPGLKAGDKTFQLGRPNYHLQLNDFPIPKTINDVISSAGVHASVFTGVNPLNNGVDNFTVDTSDPTFTIASDNVSGVSNTRNVEPRNTPSVINAVFNYRNFWDGRAQNDCNFLNPFGARDQDQSHHLYRVTIVNGVAKSATVVKPTIQNASLCSQALGPALSSFEMSAAGRTFWDLGKKILSLPRPLAQQLVSPTDSRLGGLSLAPANGLNKSYLALIQQAFVPAWWNPRFNVCVAPGANPGDPPIESLVDTKKAACPQGTTQYTMAEYNFSMFWGLAIQAYESILRSDQNRLDNFLLKADASMTTTNQGTGDGSTVTFVGKLPAPLLFSTVNVTAGLLSGQDDGLGNIISDTGDVTGTVDYTTGDLSLTFTTAPALGDIVTVSSELIPKVFFTQQELLGLQIFQTKGKCASCHSGPEMTNAAVANVQNEPLERMLFPPSGMVKVYDNGFYNTGVRDTNEDIALGATDPFNNPLSMADLERQQVCDPNSNFTAPMLPARPAEGIAAAPLGCNDLINKNGNFKTPSVRGVELTAPYFHNGGQKTLLEVVDFYDRGGDFSNENQQDLDPDIEPLGLTAQEKQALVAFMLTTTDNRVKKNQAPFDHPSLLVSNGSQNGANSVLDDGIGQSVDDFILIPAVGRLGYAQPLCTFVENVTGTHANSSTPCP